MVKRRGARRGVSRYRAARVRRHVSSGEGGKSKLRPYAFGHSVGLISVIALLFYTFMAWFTDYNASIIIQQYPIVFSLNNWTIIIGLIQTYVLSYIGGWIFVKIYNKTGK
jgi:hypothetical protein